MLWEDFTSREKRPTLQSSLSAMPKPSKPPAHFRSYWNPSRANWALASPKSFVSQPSASAPAPIAMDRFSCSTISLDSPSATRRSSRANTRISPAKFPALSNHSATMCAQEVSRPTRSLTIRRLNCANNCSRASAPKRFPFAASARFTHKTERIRMNVEDFRRLYEYNSWANHRTLDACAPLSEEQFTRDLRASFRSLRDTMVHISWAEWLWLERGQGRSPDKFSSTDFPNLESVRRRWTEIERNLIEYIGALKPEDLERIISHKTTAGVPQAAPLWQMLQHLVNHGTYHRGQVAAMLRQLDAKAVSTDLILFYRERAAVQAKA